MRAKYAALRAVIAVIREQFAPDAEPLHYPAEPRLCEIESLQKKSKTTAIASKIWVAFLGDPAIQYI
jgi:hypothetical protein